MRSASVSLFASSTSLRSTGWFIQSVSRLVVMGASQVKASDVLISCSVPRSAMSKPDMTDDRANDGAAERECSGLVGGLEGRAPGEQLHRYDRRQHICPDTQNAGDVIAGAADPPEWIADYRIGDPGN